MLPCRLSIMFVRRLEMWERRPSVVEGSSPLLGLREEGGYGAAGEEEPAPCFRSVGVGESVAAGEEGEGCGWDC